VYKDQIFLTYFFDENDKNFVTTQSFEIGFDTQTGESEDTESGDIEIGAIEHCKKIADFLRLVISEEKNHICSRFLGFEGNFALGINTDDDLCLWDLKTGNQLNFDLKVPLYQNAVYQNGIIVLPRYLIGDERRARFFDLNSTHMPPLKYLESLQTQPPSKCVQCIKVMTHPIAAFGYAIILIGVAFLGWHLYLVFTNGYQDN
jgi:hypothetical protein